LTKLPVDDWSVEPHEGKPYKVGPVCSTPGCKRWADHAHHIFRRSFLQGAHAWVKIPSPEGETIVGNLCGLCFQHHQDVTENKSWIQWDYAKKRYAWWDKAGEQTFEGGGLLDPHPPLWDDPEPAKDSENRDLRGDSENRDDEDACPTCRRRLPQQLSRLPRRRRKTWVVSVPDDSEDGAGVLDVLVEECAKIFQREEHHDYRYFTLVEAMSLLLQSKERIS